MVLVVVDGEEEQGDCVLGDGQAGEGWEEGGRDLHGEIEIEMGIGLRINRDDQKGKMCNFKENSICSGGSQNSTRPGRARGAMTAAGCYGILLGRKGAKTAGSHRLV